jgi:transposase
MNRDELERLSKDALIDLVLRLQRPAKTSRTSSLSPSSDAKSEWEPPLSKEERREKSRPGGAKPGHKGHYRALAADPDEVIDHEPSHCAHCLALFGADAERELLGESDAIEIPVLKPYVRRHRRFGLRCGHCQARTEADLPDEAKGTPFGPRIHGLAIYLKTRHAFSYERMAQAFADLFGLSVSEGALMNMFKRTGAAFQAKREEAEALLRQAEVVASDETGVRIEGVGGYHWVFCSKQAIVHTVDFTRAGAVVREVMGGHEPQVWISDRYSAQQGHGLHQQTCLAHLARDVEYAHQASEDQAPLRLKLWLDRAFALARDILDLAPSTRRTKQRGLERDIDAILASPTACSFAQAVIAKFARARQQLLTFCRFPGEVAPTNNQSERELRPAVIQRKVTNGYRAQWAAGFEADVRTTISTMRLKGADPFQTILATIGP